MNWGIPISGNHHLFQHFGVAFLCPTGMLDRLRGQGPGGACRCRAEASDENTGGALFGNGAWAVGARYVYSVLFIKLYYITNVIYVLLKYLCTTICTIYVLL
jgi:hypothetical protein